MANGVREKLLTVSTTSSVTLKVAAPVPSPKPYVAAAAAHGGRSKGVDAFAYGGMVEATAEKQ